MSSLAMSARFEERWPANHANGREVLTTDNADYTDKRRGTTKKEHF